MASKLDEHVREADAMGMSYGKYMNDFHPAGETPAAEQEPEDLAKIGTKVCEYCGKEFPVYDKRKHKYCSKECSQKANYEKIKGRIVAASKANPEPEAVEKPESKAAGISDHDKIRIAKMILMSALETGSECNYIISITDAFDVLNLEGKENAD